MPRKSRKAEPPIADTEWSGVPETSDPSPLPEDVGEFMKTMAAQKAEKRREMGGMVAKKWAGIPMWQCPRCRGTTFNEAESRVHTCKQVKFASDSDE